MSSKYTIDELKAMVSSSLGVINSNTCFIQVPNSFVRRTDLNITEKMLYMYFWGYGIDLRPSYPSHKLISEHLGISRNTIVRTLKSLEEKGGVYVINRRYKDTNAKTTNLYYLAQIDNNTGGFMEQSLELVKQVYPDKIAYI